MTTGRSSHGWTPARAPRLRRTADRIEQAASRSANPDRARRVAREMRLRAAEIELGDYASDEYETAIGVFREIGAPAPSAAA